jgi:hypothetical protein
LEYITQDKYGALHIYKYKLGLNVNKFERKYGEIIGGLWFTKEKHIMEYIETWYTSRGYEDFYLAIMRIPKNACVHKKTQLDGR